MMPTSTSNDAPINVFLSYAHGDEKLRDELAKHLSSLEHTGLISCWYDRCIDAGEEWEKAIDANIRYAQIILLLVSADFLASRYCYSIEMQYAIERHEANEAHVIPVILRDVNWNKEPFAKLNALPKNGRAVTSWENQDEALTNVALGIGRVVENFRKPSVGHNCPLKANQNVASPKIWNVQPLRNPNFTGRDNLLEDLHRNVTQTRSEILIQVIQGPAGIGKTQLALAYAYRYSDMYDAVLWVQAGEEDTLASDYAAIANFLNLPQQKSQNQLEAIKEVREWLGSHPNWLIIMDNAPDPTAVQDYFPRSLHGHILITSHHSNWVGIAKSMSVPVLSRQDSIKLLVDITNQNDVESASIIAELLQDLPRTLIQAINEIERTGVSMSAYSKQLSTRRKFTNAMTTSGSRRMAMDRPVHDLGDSLRHRLGLMRNPAAVYASKKGIVASNNNAIDGISWGEDSDDEEGMDWQDKGVTTVEVVNLLRQCDPYDTTRFLQQLSDLDILFPVYFLRQDQHTECYLHTATPRYVKKNIKIQEASTDDLTLRTVQVAGDTGLPRIVFASICSDGTAGFCGDLVRELFGNVSPVQEAKEDEASALSIEVGVQPLSNPFQPLDKPNLMASFHARRNWMVFHIKGNSVVSDEQAQVVLAHADLVIVQIQSMDAAKSSVNALRAKAGEERVFSWHSGGSAFKINKKERHINGRPKEVARFVLESVLLNENIGLRKNKKPLFDMGAASAVDVEDQLNIFLSDIGDKVRSRLPNNGTFRTELELSKLYSKERHLLREQQHSRHGNTIEVDDKIRKLQRQQFNRICEAVPSTVEILMEVLQRKTRAERLLGTKELTMQIEEAEKDALVAEFRRLNDAQRAVERSGLADNAARLELIKVKTDLNDKRTGLEHVWRELGHLYAANPEQFENAPKLAAQFWCDGGTLEFVDGDAGAVNRTWLNEVVKVAVDMLRKQLGHKPRVVVTSTSGVQSCGKSTLLNSLYGCDMHTSLGACTRGINVMLVPSSKDWKAKCDFVLLMDTEGICNPMFKGKAWYDWHNNWLATLSILAADTCLLLSNNEDDTVLQEVLPFAMLSHRNAKQTLANVGFNKRHLFFVYNRIDPEGAKDRLKDNRAHLVASLKSNKQLVDTLDNQKSTEKDSNAVFSLVNDGDFRYLGPSLNNAESYGKQVVRLRQRIDEREGLGFLASPLDNWWIMFGTLLDAMDNQDYVLSFSTIVKMKAERELRNAIGEQERIVGKAWRDAYIRVVDQLMKDSMKKVSDESVESKPLTELRNELLSNEILTEALRETTVAVKKLLEEPQNSNAKEHELREWNDFLADEQNRYGRDLDAAFDRYTSEAQTELELVTSFQKELINQVRDEKKRKELNENDAKRRASFDKLFNQWLVSLEQKYKPVDVKSRVKEVWPKEWRLDAQHEVTQKKRKKKQSFFEWLGGGNEDKRKDLATKLEGEVSSLLRSFKDAQQGPFDVDKVNKFVNLIKGWDVDNVIKAKLAKTRHDRLISTLQKIQNDWDSEHNLFIKFSRRKSEFYGKFNVLCQGLSKQVETEKLTLISLWERSIPDYCNVVALDLFTKSVRDSTWLSNSQKLFAHVNLDIIEITEKMGVEEAIKTMSDKDHSRCVQNKLMLASVPTDQSPHCEHEKRKKEVHNIFDNTLRTKINDNICLSDGDTTKFSGKTLANIVVDSLPSGFELDRSTLKSISALSSVDALAFADRLAEAIQSDWPRFDSCQWNHGYTPSWDDVKRNLPNSRGGLRARCSEPCPRCGMPCHREDGHQDKHDTYHQPTGLAGVAWLDGEECDHGGELCETSCTDSVNNNHSMVFKNENKEIPYKEFESFYPGWKLPELTCSGDDKANELFRQAFFANYQIQLAQFYGQKPNTKGLHGSDMLLIKKQLLRIISEI